MLSARAADELGVPTLTDEPTLSSSAAAPANVLVTVQAHGTPSARPVVADVAASSWAPYATADLLAALRVDRASDGTVRIEAPPQAAEALISLFHGLSKLLMPDAP